VSEILCVGHNVEEPLCHDLVLDPESLREQASVGFLVPGSRLRVLERASRVGRGPIDTAPTADAAGSALEAFERSSWGARFPTVVDPHYSLHALHTRNLALPSSPVHTKILTLLAVLIRVNPCSSVAV